VDEAVVGLVFVISVFASTDESNIDESTLLRPKDLGKAHVQVENFKTTKDQSL
jgi:hypothetical protein